MNNQRKQLAESKFSTCVSDYNAENIRYSEAYCWAFYYTENGRWELKLDNSLARPKFRTRNELELIVKYTCCLEDWWKTKINL